MKNIIWTYVLIFSFISCVSDKKSEFLFVINFSPTFINTSTLTLTKLKEGVQVDFVVYNDTAKHNVDFEETVKIPEDDLADFVPFIHNYDFATKQNQDTIGVEKYVENGDSVVAYVVTEGLDGIKSSGKFIENDVNKTFAFWSPNRETENYELVHRLLAISDRSFSKKETKEYLAKLRRYFH